MDELSHGATGWCTVRASGGGRKPGAERESRSQSCPPRFHAEARRYAEARSGRDDQRTWLMRRSEGLEVV